MNAPELPKHFTYFPGDYRWSAEMLVVIGTAQYGGADFSEADRIARTLLDRVGDDDAWFRAWCKGAELLRARAQSAEAAGHDLTASSNYLRSCFYYQIADHFRQPKDEDALAAYRVSLECFRKYAALTGRPRIETVELPFKGGGAFPAYFVHGEGSEARKPCVVRFGGFDKGEDSRRRHTLRLRSAARQWMLDHTESVREILLVS